MDLRKMQDGEDWSPDCENLTASVTSNPFNFTMRSIDKTKLLFMNFSLLELWWRTLVGTFLLVIGVDLLPCPPSAKVSTAHP